MELKFERDVAVEASADQLRSRLLQWSNTTGFVCVSDLRDSWTFTRGTQLDALVAFDVTQCPTEVVVQFDPATKIVRASIVVKSPLTVQTNGDARRLEVETEALVACIRGTTSPTTQAPRRTSKGGLLNAFLRGAAGMKAGYLEVRRERLKEERANKKPKSAVRTLGYLFVLLLACGVAAIVYVVVAAPQVLRVRGVQAPVNVTLRDGFLTANVVQVQNLSREHLPNVVVTASRPSTRKAEARRIGTLAPGQLVELGGLEWNWVIHDGDTVTVKADGYLPIVFSSDQMVGR